MPDSTRTDKRVLLRFKIWGCYHAIRRLSENEEGTQTKKNCSLQCGAARLRHRRSWLQSEILFRLPSRSRTVRLQKKGESRTIYDAGWSSLVARRAHNPEVVGSNPTPATNF